MVCARRRGDLRFRGGRRTRGAALGGRGSRAEATEKWEQKTARGNRCPRPLGSGPASAGGKSATWQRQRREKEKRPAPGLRRGCQIITHTVAYRLSHRTVYSNVGTPGPGCYLLFPKNEVRPAALPNDSRRSFRATAFPAKNGDCPWGDLLCWLRLGFLSQVCVCVYSNSSLAVLNLTSIHRLDFASSV